jgi:hypothetical protein
MKQIATLLFVVWGIRAHAEIKAIDFSDFVNDVTSFANALGEKGYAHHPFDSSRCSFQVSLEEGSLTAALRTQAGVKQISIPKETIIQVDEFESDYDDGYERSFFKENEEKPFLSIQKYPGVFQRAKINIDGEAEFSAWMECFWDARAN